MYKDKDIIIVSVTGTTGGTLNLDNYLGSNTKIVYIEGTKTLDQNFHITATSSGVGEVIHVFSEAVITPSTFQLTVFGRNIPDAMAIKRWSGTYIARGGGSPKFHLFADFTENGFLPGVGIDPGSITTTQISDSAGIPFSKLESLTANRVPVINSSGKIEAGTFTTTKLAYLESVTSDIQAQLDAKAEIGSASLTTADIAPDAAIPTTKLAALTASRVPVLNSSGFIEASSATATELGYLSGVTSAIQTQINARIPTLLSQGNILVGNASNAAQALDAKTSGRILVGNGTTVQSVAVSGDATLSGSGALTISANAITPAKVTAEMRTEVITVPISWETNFTGNTTKIYIPYACSLTYIHASIVKTVAGTDNAFITLFDNSNTAMGGASLVAGALTVPASTAAGTVVASTVTANNAFTAGQILQLKSDKATAGGSAVVTLVVVRS